MEKILKRGEAETEQKRALKWERQRRLFEQAQGAEDVSLRDAFTKRFRLGGGRCQAVVYSEPVHYRESGCGEWKEIDNNLEPAKDGAGRDILRNRAGAFRVELPARADSGAKMKMAYGGRVLEWWLEKPGQVEAVLRNGAGTEAARQTGSADARRTEQQKRMDRRAYESEAEYPGVRPGLSLRYRVSGEQVKEDIILENRAALENAALVFSGEYCYTVGADQSLRAADKATGEEVFRFEPPYVYDAAGRETVAEVALQEAADGCRVRYSLDEAFLAAAQYPVTIDPVGHSTGGLGIIHTTTLVEDTSATPWEYDHIKIGRLNGLRCVGLLKFLVLAPLKASDTIVGAALAMCPKSTSASRYIAAYPVRAGWDRTSANWLNFDPDSAENIEPYAQELVRGTDGGWLSFDVTNLYNDWCKNDGNGDSQNFGVAFRTPERITGDNYSELYSPLAASGYRPMLVINYLSHAGIEDWWQYEQRSAGRAGMVYADLFNGNLVLEHVDTAMSGNRMPVSVAHYYNSCQSDTNENGCGYGWKLSAQQRVDGTQINEDAYFVWTDGDGTEHYFKVEGSQPYKDSEGMGLKLTYHDCGGETVAGDWMILTDKGHNEMRFTVVEPGKAWLTSIQDACGNTASYSYLDMASGKLSKITDPVGRETVFSYSGDLLSSIRIPDVDAENYRYVYYTYDASDRLTGIRYSDLGGNEPHTQYSYDGTTGMLVRAKNFDGGCVDIGYEALSAYNSAAFSNTNTDQMRRVLSLESLHMDAGGQVTARGAKQTFAYANMVTEVTAVEGETSDAGKKLQYQFNDAGNVVCVCDELGFSRFTKYESGIENKPSEQSRLRRAVVNRLRSPDLYANWTAVTNGAGTAERDETTKCMSVPAVKLVKSGATGEVLYRQQVTLEGDTEFTLSAYAKTENLTGEHGAYLRIARATDAQECAVSEELIGSVGIESGNELATDGWERVCVRYRNGSAAAGEYVVELVNGADSGTAWFACPQLERGTVANSFNLVGNGDFRHSYTSGGQTLPLDWTAGPYNLNDANTGVFSADTDASFPAALEGGYVQIEGRPDYAGVGFTQSFRISGKAGDTFVVGGWGSARSVANATSSAHGFGLALRLKRATDGVWSDYIQYAFNSEWVGWQSCSFAAQAGADYSEVDLTLVYTTNCNRAKFTNVYLYREAYGNSYGYDAEGNLVSAGTLAGQKSDIRYDDAENASIYVQPGRDKEAEENQYWGLYGDTEAERKKHLLRRSRTPMHRTDAFGYDSYGNRVSSRRVDYRVYTENTAEDAYPYMRTEQTYTQDGNYVQTTKDARGNVVTQAVNGYDGTVTSVTDPANQTVCYAYDASRRVTGVETTGDAKTYRNAYTYEEDRLKTVSHNTTADGETDVTYTFEYDELGRKTTVKVGTQALSTNEYEENRSGLLKEVQYGNGGRVKYAYDEYDRLVGSAYDAADVQTAPRYSYEYGANGKAARVRDNALERTTETEYDLADRPVRATQRNAAGEVQYRTTLGYDKYANLTQFREETGGGTYTTTIGYDRDNRATTVGYGDAAHKVEYTYDALGRISERTATNGTGSGSAAVYSYAAGGYGTNSTTALVSGIVQGTGGNAMQFAYAYDTRGNIVSETRNGAVTTYGYDALGQLIRVDDPNDPAGGAGGTTWKYTYDRGGNIRTKTSHAYTTGEVGTAVETVTYTYADGNWKDKLTAYGGVGITYDAIGNPLTDGKRRYEWQAGRQLKKILLPRDPAEWIAEGTDAGSGVTLRISFTNGNVLAGGTATTTASAGVWWNGTEITEEYAASAFNWTRESGDAEADAAWNAQHAGTKSIVLTASDLTVNGADADVQISCTLTGSGDGYGSVDVDSALAVTHTPDVLDAQDVFAIVDGDLRVTTGRGGVYSLAGGDVRGSGSLLSGTVTAEARVFVSQPEDEVAFAYDHNGLRVRKKVTRYGGAEETTDYTLHGKLVTHLVKWNVTAEYVETVDEMHFFYDAQSRPAMASLNGTMYTYVHNLQGDIVAILDSAGSKVVEYQYDAWGRPIGAWSKADAGLESSLISEYALLKELNPFRYRGYVWDEETGLYYLRSRYYEPVWGRFVNADNYVAQRHFSGKNIFAYCENGVVGKSDASGHGTESSTTFPNSGTLSRWIFEKVFLAITSKDSLGKRLLKHWFYGEGEDLKIKNDDDVSSYLWKNNVIQSNIRRGVCAQILANNCNYSQHLTLAIDPNNGVGGASTGYNMINRCEITVEGSWERNEEGYSVKIDYQLADTIDANVTTDMGDAIALGVMRMLVLNGESGRDYSLEINGSWNFNITTDDLYNYIA